MQVAWWRLLGWSAKDKPLSQYIVVKDNAFCEGAPFMYQLASVYLQNNFCLLYLSTETPWYSLYLSLRKLGVRLDSSFFKGRILFLDVNVKNPYDLTRQVCSSMDQWLTERLDSEPLSLAILVDSATSILYLSNQSNSFSLLFHYLRVMGRKLSPTLYCEAKFYDSLILQLDALPLGVPSEQDGRLSIEERDQAISTVLFKILENQIKFFTI
ncbi:Nuclear pore complex protein Nup107 [Galdieria sulphuraria]|nr:Nuclear pore complex protein Nup107 [Galdieria sulphuraria]